MPNGNRFRGVSSAIKKTDRNNGVMNLYYCFSFTCSKHGLQSVPNVALYGGGVGK